LPCGVCVCDCDCIFSSVICRVLHHCLIQRRVSITADDTAHLQTMFALELLHGMVGVWAEVAARAQGFTALDYSKFLKKR
jgi:hypothetical protein